jgi:nucleotide-binding universal stress UspA family protein
VLVEACATSDLVVVGRHSGPARTPAGLGGIARSLIRQTRCPLMVVPV